MKVMGSRANGNKARLTTAGVKMQYLGSKCTDFGIKEKPVLLKLAKQVNDANSMIKFG